MPAHHVRRDRQAEVREPGRVAVGVQDQGPHLRACPLQHMGQNRPAGQGPQALVVPPPMRRDWPPAKSTPANSAILVLASEFQPVSAIIISDLGR